VHISEGTYFQHDTAEDVLKAAIATGHEVHADVQDLHKDIRGLKGVGVFSVSIHSYNQKSPSLTCL
jgi:alcohol oxidase